jgi:hypothetical protein
LSWSADRLLSPAPGGFVDAVGLAGEDSTFGFVAGFAIDFPSGIPLPLIASPKAMWLI